jgi:glycosyltransferase involved in cell wall biosynthesis/uncharacterized membrane protein YbhN (UPF0104 family)
MRCVIVVPTYNEAATVGGLLDAVAAVKVETPQTLISVLVVDDNSPDGTGDIVRAHPGFDRWVHLLSRDSKEGLGAAYRAGFAAALRDGYDVVIQMDADGSHPTQAIPAMLDLLATNDVAVGSRYVPGGQTVNWPVRRRALSWAANAYARTLLLLRTRDTTSGFRAWNAAAIRAAGVLETTTSGYGFQVENTWNCERRGLRVAESLQEESRGGSRSGAARRRASIRRIDARRGAGGPLARGPAGRHRPSMSTSGTASRVSSARGRNGRGPTGVRSDRRAKLRFLLSWGAGAALALAILPRAVDVSWHAVLPALGSVRWRAALALSGVWFLGLFVHSFVLTAAAPSLTHRRALTLNLTGSAVANVVPLGGAAGVELNRRMMRAWGIDGPAFTGYTLLTNLWDVASKLLLPVIAAVALARAGEHVSRQGQTASVMAGAGFVVLAAAAAAILISPRGALFVGRVLEPAARRAMRIVGKDEEPELGEALLDLRDQCAGLVARGWLQMSAGIAGYIALQGLLLGMCLHLTGGGNTWPEVLAGFAVERALTIVPITPGGVGVADLGLVSVLLALGGDPVSVTGAAVLYRAFIFAVEIPVGGGALGVWLLSQHRLAAHKPERQQPHVPPHRIAQVTDVFLPRLGGIETHVDDLAHHQRAVGLDVDVLTPSRSDVAGPVWVRRISAKQARRAVIQYDLVHVHVSMFSPYAIGVAHAAVNAGIPVLITVHSMWSGAGGVLRVTSLAGLRRWPVAWSAVSSAAAETFSRSLGGVTVSVLPNAVDVTDWCPRHDRPAARSSASEPVTIISVMRLMPRKRPLQLVKMFEEVRELTSGDDVRLVVVGDGPLRHRIERYVKRRGLGEHVHITGRLTRPQVREHLDAASLYVAPAPKESFGIAALEARCVGLPVVANRRSGVREFVRDRVDGLLVDGDAAMKVSLADLVRDEALRTQITSHNQVVRPPFDWVDALGRTNELYEVAAARVAARRPEHGTVSAAAAAGRLQAIEA